MSALECSRGDLSPFQLIALDRIIASHDLPPLTPYEVPELIAWVCLGCGSIGEAPTQADRDLIVENFDVTCCSTTVVFHSRNKVLVDPSKLTLVKSNKEI